MQFRVSHFSVLFLLMCVLLLGSCGTEPVSAPKSEPEPLSITEIVSSVEPIDPENPLPTFTDFFEEGTEVIYTYVSIQNAETMTGSFPVRLRWFSPNDFRPPIAQRMVEMEPDQNIAQFSIHNEDGLGKGPYMLIARAGRDLSSLTATGSARFFIGMTQEEAQEFLEQEAEVKAQREKKRKIREAERKKQKEEDGLKEALSGAVMGMDSGLGSGSGDEGSEESEDMLSSSTREASGEKPSGKDADALPPKLTSGIEEEDEE